MITYEPYIRILSTERVSQKIPMSKSFSNGAYFHHLNPMFGAFNIQLDDQTMVAIREKAGITPKESMTLIK